MLNVTPIRGNNQYAAARYFSAADDYYAKETPGEWQGEGAERLGLVGPVDQLQLAKLLDGKLPNGERIHTTFNAETNKRRMGCAGVRRNVPTRRRRLLPLLTKGQRQRSCQWRGEPI